MFAVGGQIFTVNIHVNIEDLPFSLSKRKGRRAVRSPAFDLIVQTLRNEQPRDAPTAPQGPTTLQVNPDPGRFTTVKSMVSMLTFPQARSKEERLHS